MARTHFFPLAGGGHGNMANGERMHRIPWEGVNMRKVYIYRIINKVNGKCYVGKTLDYYERMRVHFSPVCWDREPNKALYLAMKKYGSGNFKKEVLEVVNEENWQEREVFWIDYYNSLEKGYNMIPGGTQPPVQIGEENPMSKLVWKEVHEIIELLKEGKLMKRDIAFRYNISIDQIIRINKGDAWKVKGIDYPINLVALDEDVVLEIINLLENSDLKHIEIADKFGVARTTITAINRGQNHRIKGFNYPIRDRNKNIKEVQQLLLTTKIPMTEINKIYNKHRTWASEINTGRILKDPNLNYPLRKR